MKAVMMNPATPADKIKEIVVECKPRPKEEVGRFTGRMGGRIVITAELWKWVHKKAKDIAIRLTEENRSLQRSRLTPTKDEIIKDIQAELMSGAYENEPIELGYSTIEKMLSYRYLDMLKTGWPATEQTLHNEEVKVEQERQDGQTNLATTAEAQRTYAQIYLQSVADQTKPLRAWQAKEPAEIFAIYPGVDWPETPLTLDQMKKTIETAIRLKIKRVKPRPKAPRAKQKRRVNIDELDFS